MRHRITGRHFNRSGSCKKAMFLNMSKSLIKHEKIKTTLEKAKELRTYLEPIITLSKINNLNNRRKVFSKIRDKKLVHKLFFNLGIRFFNRCGGYIHILKYKCRLGDGATIVIVKFVDKVF